MFSAKTMQIGHIYWDLVFRRLNILHRTTIKVHLLGVYAASSSPWVFAGGLQLSLHITSRGIIHTCYVNPKIWSGKDYSSSKGTWRLTHFLTLPSSWLRHRQNLLTLEDYLHLSLFIYHYLSLSICHYYLSLFIVITITVITTQTEIAHLVELLWFFIICQ